MSKPSEGKVCRAVIDRHDVMKNQVIASVREALGADESNKALSGISESVVKIFQVHTNGLINNISKEFAK